MATVSDEHLRGARQLLIDHGRTEALRGPDALQLSVALGLKRAGLVSVFVAADQKLCRVAIIEASGGTGTFVVKAERSEPEGLP